MWYETRWNHSWGITNSLLFDIVEEDENEAKECIDEDVCDMELDAKSFDLFYDHAIIFINWIKQWLNTIVSPNSVEKIYARP